MGDDVARVVAGCGVLFPGQGAQFVGMGGELIDTSSAARARFEEAADLLGWDLAAVCREGPEERLDRTDVSQPALFVHSAAVLAALGERGWDGGSVQIAAGLSLGEYTALFFAGAIGFADGVRLVAERGRAMQAACEAAPSGMLSVIGLDAEAVESLARESAGGDVLVVANYNAPGQTVLSGDLPALERAERLAKERGARRAVRLAVAGGYHSPRMGPATEALAAALAGIEIRPPRVPVLSNVTAEPAGDPASIRDLLARQIVSPVRWTASMLHAGRETLRFYEIGAGRVLAGLMKRIVREAHVFSIGEPDDLAKLASDG